MDFTIYDVALVPVIIGLVSVFTGVGLPKSLAPLVSLVLGVLAGVLYVAPGDLAQGVVVGIALGLASVGLYSGAKNTVESVKRAE